MERQQQHGTGVVRVEPRTLALGRAEGEELLEEFFVNHDPADQRRQHAHRQSPHQIDPQQARHMQGEVKQEEKPATHRFSHRQYLAGRRIEGHRYAVPSPARGGLQLGRAFVGQADAPLCGVGLVGAQIIQRGVHRLFVAQVMCGQFGVHPVIDLLIEHREAAGQEDYEQ